MKFYEVLVLLGTSVPVAALIIAPNERQASFSLDDEAEPNWSMDSVYVNARRELRVLTNVIPNDVIPAFAFESRGHMESMVVDWGRLHDYNVTLAVRGRKNDKHGLARAFQIIEENKPRVAVWLLEFKDGNAHTLGDLAEGFLRTKTHTRNIVFHWSPEFCDYKGLATFDRISHAYEHAASVFQFAYQDERLASLDSGKFKPWPLGPAWWKGWVTPSSRQPTTAREHFASFRGARNTHRELAEVQGLVSNWTKPIDLLVEDSGKCIPHPGSGDIDRYRELLETSKYVLNLAGNNPNCYRVAESIESGAIPVTVTRKGLYGCYDNWAALYGHATGTAYPWIPKAPFEVLQSWDQLPSRFESMLSYAEERGSVLQSWYKQWRQSFIDEFASTIS